MKICMEKEGSDRESEKKGKYLDIAFITGENFF